MKKPILYITPLLLAFVFLVGCGGGGKDSGDDKGTGKGTPEETKQTDEKFPPQDITAEKEAFYKEKSDFFSFKTIDDLPADLEWINNDHLPEVGSPNAKKGGTANARLQDFPSTLRTVGPNANSSFRNYLLDDVAVRLARRHPETLEFFPGLANEWAIDKPSKTVFVRLDPKAKWSDGEAITSDDFVFMFFFFQSKHLKAPWYNNWYGTQYTNITKYDDLTFSISVPEVKPDIDARVLELVPRPEHFYKEMGGDFPQRYQWRFEPTTAAYVVKDEDLKKGRSVSLSRLENWWAKDKKHYRYRYNPDRIEFKVIRDTPKSFEEFKAGNLDGFGLNLSEYWYNKLPDSNPLVQNGYVKKATFYNDRPRPTYGLWINRSKPLLSNKDVRIGINYATNWGRVIDKYFRGDYARMKTTSDGFASFSHPTLKARPYDIKKATEHFAKAGFDKRGGDGILVNSNKERLSFTLTGSEFWKDMLPILKQEARKAGVDLKLEVLDSTSAYKKTQEKKHDLAFSAFGTFVEMYPRYWETWHGVNAYEEVDGKKKVKTQTNNLTVTSIPELDEMIIKYRKSEDAAEMKQLAHKMEEILHDDAAFVPGFVQPFYRVAYWRWMNYPDDFNVKISEGSGEWFVSWIDQAAKEETLAARKSGKTFPPSIEVYDQYKVD